MPETAIEIPDDVSATLDRFDVTVEGPNGRVTRRLWYPDVTVEVDDDTVVISSPATDAKTQSTMGTFESHVRNMFHGVTEGWEYTMTAFYSHFPMQLSVEGDEVVIQNFLGETAPRRATIKGDTEVSVDGDDLVLTGPNIEDVGQTAADIEQLTRVKDKDTRVFQDGVYITEKPKRGEA